MMYICNNRTLIILLSELLSVISPVRVECKLIISGRAQTDSLLYCSPLYITLCFVLYESCCQFCQNQTDEKYIRYIFTTCSLPHAIYKAMIVP